MRTGILLIMVIGLFYCTPPKYIVKKQSEIVKLDLNNSLINYIPLSDNDLGSSEILDSSYYLITNKRYSKLYKYINTLEKSGVKTSDLYLSKTLLLIANNDYSNAFKSLELINDSDYLLLNRLLSIDLNYEIEKIYGGLDYKQYLKNYQEIIDAYPNDSCLTKIVAIRLRYLRYNY
jgi:hypothetical protein